MLYAVPNSQGEHVQVCRNMFSKVFALSHKTVQILIDKKRTGSSIYVDTREQANKPRKYTEEIKQIVINHINSFSREENHYSRYKSEKESLSPDLNLNRMFMVLKKYPDSSVNYRFYSDTFNKLFPHLYFGKPPCATCDLLNNKIKASSVEAQRTFKSKFTPAKS
ncbi:hypothetical protein JTB14_021784 [Gonioctena quinquepunctata]|nr:hypothetical protein JTB14_021784 [Gonioctena quinquepunctata]